MNTALLLTTDDVLRERLMQALGDISVFTAGSNGEALRTLRMVDIDALVFDARTTRGPLAEFLAAVRRAAPGIITIAVGAGEPEEQPEVDAAIGVSFAPRELQATVRDLLERQRLQREIMRLRAHATSATAPSGDDGWWDRNALARVVKSFTGVVAAGTDLPRVVELFLDAIGDVVRPTRSALLLVDPDGREHRIVASRGLAPQLVQGIRLSADTGLARWLAVQGRPATLGDVTDPDVLRELKLLQGIVAVPLLAHGELAGILVLGQPVFGSAYGRRGLETLFDLTTHLATVIRDITLHQRLAREKAFTERILFHMSSGVVTIGRDERVVLFNRRAEEILGLPAASAVGQDLRALPSPLGDMLYETMTSGRAVARTEVQLALRRLWLEISTYPIRDEHGESLGAVLVFEDLTAQKELAAQRRQGEQFQLLTRVVARIADEIKNPLVSINTFIELISERYDDPDFRKHFSVVVRRDVRRLVEVFEKLAGLVTEGELNFSTVDARDVLSELVDAIDVNEDGFGKHLQLEVAPEAEPQLVKVDAGQLRRALLYLVRYLTHNSPGDVARISLSVGTHDDRDGTSTVRLMVSSRTASVSSERLQRLFDPVDMVQESLVDVGPAVSQRLVEALGGQLRVRQGRHELAFLIALPAVT